MNPYRYSISFFTLLVAATTSFADTNFSTNFTGGEGYTSGGLDSSANFNELNPGGMFLPSGQASTGFGTARRNPSARGATVFYTTGEGSAFNAGATWTTSLDFKFQGLPSTDPTGSSSIFMGSTGFSTSSTANANIMYSGIQKTSGQAGSTNYQFFISGGGFSSTNISYESIGDDNADATDQTDNLRITFTLTKSATTNEFNAVASLVNTDTAQTVATIVATLTRANAYSSDLYGYFKASSLAADPTNFDLFDVDAFLLRASEIPEPETYSMLLGCVALIIMSLGRVRAFRK